MTAVRLSILTVLLVLAGCKEPTSIGSREVEAASRMLTPQDSEIAAIYQRSCRSCHTIAATGAPLTGDTAAWSVRMEKGMDAMIDSVVNGFGGMPPLGLCMDCDAAQFEALVLFMASGASDD